MASGYFKDDPIEGIKDLDDEYVTDAWLVDQFVGNQLWAWGKNAAAGSGESGKLGLSDTTHRSSPVQVGSLTNWKQVSGGDGHTVAIKIDGTLWSWGYNVFGQLGLSTDGEMSSPVQVGTLTDWKQVEVGTNYSLAIKTDNTLWSWGYNFDGQLGLSNNGTRSSPVQVGTLTDWKNVTATKSDQSYAVKIDGTLWAWGYNSIGALGLGNTTHRSSPVQVGSLTNWKQVTGNGQNSYFNTTRALAIKTDGTLWAWGGNSSGGLGLGNTTSVSSPVQVGTSTNWKLISAGVYHTVAIKTDGTLWSWGSYDVFNITLLPVQIGSLTNWKQVIAVGHFDLAVKTDGTLWAWGDNVNGQLGLGDRTHRSSPVQVGTLTNWKQVNVGTGYSLAITYKDIG